MLHLAAVHGHSMIFGYIMKRVTNKNPANDWGYTPLHGAAEYGHVEICKLILNKVQNKSPKDHNGETPLDLAKKKSPMDHDGTTEDGSGWTNSGWVMMDQLRTGHDGATHDEP